MAAINNNPFGKDVFSLIYAMYNRLIRVLDNE